MRSSKKAPVMWKNDKGETVAFDWDVELKKGKIILKVNDLRFVREFAVWAAEQSVMQLAAF